MSDQQEERSRHEQLWEACETLPSDFEPYGERPRNGHPDCSVGCKFFEALFDPEREAPDADWGVCTNPASPRAGMLTFEHQGCPQFEYGGDYPGGDDDQN